jgi:hypothetical protein
MAGGRVDWRVGRPFGDVEIELHPSESDPATREASVRELGYLISDFKYRQPEARRVLLDVYARLRGLNASTFQGQAFDFDTGSPRTDAIGAELLHEAQVGNLVVRRRVTRSVVVPLEVEDEPVLGPESGNAATETTWIAIELLGEDGLPIPGEAYQITLPDGSTRDGALDNTGKAMIRGIDPDQCGVTFPQLDQQTWGLAGG